MDTEVPIKVTLEKKLGRPVLRRTRLCQPTYDTVRRTVSQWTPGETFRMEYVDDEGDLVGMDSQEEWEECLRQWRERGSQGTVHIHVMRRKGCDLPAHTTPRMAWIRRSKPEVVGCVMAHLYGDDIKERILRGEVTPESLGCGEWMSRLPGGDIDVDVGRLLNLLHEWGMQALETHDHSRAAKWFEMETDLNPTGSVPPYNLACALSLLGEGDRALDALEEAVRRGYHDIGFMRIDPDLEPLRSHPRWESILACLVPGKCEGCGYAVMPGCSHCCAKCSKKPGKHGWKCARVAADPTESTESDKAQPSCCRTRALRPGCHARYCSKGQASASQPPETERKCDGCNYVLTGRHPTHCCKRCSKVPGTHGIRCQRKQQQQQQHSEADAAPSSPVASAAKNHVPLKKCQGCDFTVTGILPTHCCLKCSSSPGQHGPRCQRLALGVTVEINGPVGKCAGCDYALAGVNPTHCCNRCSRSPGEHGPACKHIPHPVPDTVPVPQGVLATRCLEPVLGVPIQMAEDETQERNQEARKCDGCDFMVTGITPNHCCLRCSKSPGEHGPRCKQTLAVNAYHQQLAQLRELGFTDEPALQALLSQHNGDVMLVLNSLLNDL